MEVDDVLIYDDLPSDSTIEMVIEGGSSFEKTKEWSTTAQQHGDSSKSLGFPLGKQNKEMDINVCSGRSWEN